ncbi:hypothetical protein F5Y04DRAFT_215762 [Hypomontagnella monticulosa]|nr:hypothetical protein F5Y04DRAFT_215762 [Hypomontagnella monticulosa]
MPERIPVLKRPGFVFSREKADKGITNEEFDVGRGLFSIVADVAERKAVTEQHVAKFMNLAIRIKHEYRGDYIVGVLIFCGVLCQLKLIGRDRRCLDAIVALLKFVIDRPLPGSQLKPFTQTDLVNGLSTLYDSPGIWPSTHHPPSFDTCFHDFVAALYKSEVLKDPAFFVCLMRDLLESS